MTDPQTLLPRQHEGVAKEVHHHLRAESEAASIAAFERAKERLRNVNAWAAITEGVSASFQLCDGSGKPLQRPAEEGDLVRIDLPAPGRAGGSGYDWVQLSTVQEGEGEEGPWIVLTTKPVPDPTVKDPDTAHFFDTESTGTFIIQRKDLRIEASHYGRNEQPNTGEGGILDKARALLVTIGAYLGLSDMQWSNLIKGLLAPQEKS